MISSFVILLGLCLAVQTQKRCLDYPYRVVVNSQLGNDSACYSNYNVSCRTLAGALKRPSLNSSCIVLTDSQNLVENVSLEFVHDLLILGESEERISVTCLTVCNTSVGFWFRNSTDVHFLNVSFYRCGTQQLSTSRPILYEDAEIRPVLYAAFYFVRCFNIYFSKVVINRSEGYGIVMYDTGGRVKFDMLEVSFGVNVSYLLPNGSRLDGFASGGGVYLEFTEEADFVHNSDSQITFSSCLFQENWAEYTYSIPTESKGPDHVPFGRGGGVTVFFRGSASQNVLHFRKTRFIANKALWGAGLFIEHHDESKGNNITLEFCDFSKNDAFYAGGGIRVGHVRDKIVTPSTLGLTTVTFMENWSFYGGAFSQYRYVEDRQDDEATTFVNCSMEGNHAIQGFALTAEFTSFIVRNLNISKGLCRDWPGFYVCTGAVYLFRTFVTFEGLQNEVFGNAETGFILDKSGLLLRNNSLLLFRQNSGTDGGAIALYGHSYIAMEQSAWLVFLENNASKRGGAIFVDIPGPTLSRWNTTQLSPYNCFFQLLPSQEGFNGSVKFVRNQAGENKASAIYASSLESCREDDTPGVNDTFRGAHFIYKDQCQPEIVTNPVKLMLSQDDWSDAYPGKVLHPLVQLLDEKEQSVGGTVKVTVTSVHCHVFLMSSYYVVRNNSIDIQFLRDDSSDNCSFSVEVDVSIGPSLKAGVYNVLMHDCPFGYKRIYDQCTCRGDQLGNGIYGCDNGRALVLNGRWATPTETVTFPCPAGYCINRTAVYFVLDLDNQCRSNRSQNSVLCGTCAYNHSVPIFGEQCQNCSSKRWWWAWIMVTSFIIISSLVMLVMLLRVDIYSGYLNGFLYSCQVIGLLINSNQIQDPFIKFFLGVTTTEGTGELFDGWCFYDGMDNLHKLAINYCFPVYTILFIALVCYVAKRNQDGKFAGYFTRDRCFFSFAIISAFVYSDFARITFMLLNPVRVSGRLRLFVQGDIYFFEGRHLVFGIVALLVGVVIVLGVPLLLLFTPWFYRRFASLVYIMPIFDAFKHCYRTDPDRQYFSSFYFLWRGLLFSIYVFSSDFGLRKLLLSLACIAFLVVFLLLWPYKSSANNLLDAAMLTNLALISIISVISFRTSLVQLEYLSYVTLGLMYVPLLMIICKISWSLYEKARNVSARRESYAEGVAAPLIPARVMIDN